MLPTLVAAATLVCSGLAGADGGSKPSAAPSIVAGVQYNGSAIPASFDFYRLPSLREGDVVTVVAQVTGGGGTNYGMCIAGDVDDYNYDPGPFAPPWRGCNQSNYEQFSTTGQRRVFRIAGGASSYFLRLYGVGTHTFKIESIRRPLYAQWLVGGSVSRKADVGVVLRQAGGAFAPDGVQVWLIVEVNGVRYSYLGTVRGGGVVYKLDLPPNAENAPSKMWAIPAGSFYSGGGEIAATIVK